MIFLSFLKLTFVWRLKQIGSNKSKVTLPYFFFTGRETDMTSIESHDQGWTEVRVTWQNIVRNNNRKNSPIIHCHVVKMNPDLVLSIFVG
ncbi:MAG: hypothetical protein ACM3JQ_03965, partial [Candidatus Eiseniibacteriota bacterium]